MGDNAHSIAFELLMIRRLTSPNTVMMEIPTFGLSMPAED
jgi:hypothetical protein